jgi:hypothetical protein
MSGKTTRYTSQNSGRNSEKKPGTRRSVGLRRSPGGFQGRNSGAEFYTGQTLIPRELS